MSDDDAMHSEERDNDKEREMMMKMKGAVMCGEERRGKMH